MKLFIADKVDFNYDLCEFYIGNLEDKKIINETNYEKFKDILKFQNCINKKQNDEFANLANAKAEEIKNKILKGRQLIKGRESEITLDILISALAANGENGLNIINIWDLTFYQFNDQFSMMKMVEDFDINIQSMLAGAKIEDLKHYIRPKD
jgi:hypothetical protein